LDHHTAPLAQDRTVCMLGLGELGRVCAETLRKFCGSFLT